MRTHCPDQRDLDGDRARSGPRACCRGIARPAIWARFRRSLVPLTAWDVAIQSRLDRSGYAAQGRRLRSSPDQGDLLPPARRLAHRPTGAASSIVGEGAAGWVQRSWRNAQSRGWRETLRIAGGHRAFSRAGLTGTAPLGRTAATGTASRSRRRFGLRTLEDAESGRERLAPGRGQQQRSGQVGP
jgi:hypothetical protein